MATILVYTRSSATAAFPIVRGLLRLQDRGHHCELVIGDTHLAAIADTGLSVSTAGDGRAGSGTDADREPEAEDLIAQIDRVRPDLLLLDSSASASARRAAARSPRWAIVALRPSAITRLRLNPPEVPVLVPLDPWWRGVVGVSDAAVVSSGSDETCRATREIWTGTSSWEPAGPASSWLTAPGDPWVVLTTGGTADEDDDVIASRVALARSAVAALRNQPVRLVITLGAAFDAAHLIPAPNLRVLRFWPHRQILDHAGAMIAPATSTAVTTSLAAGVPVVAVPFDAPGDRAAEALITAGMGTAVPLKKLRARRLRPAVWGALRLADQVRASAAGFVDDTAPGRFADAVESLLGT